MIETSVFGLGGTTKTIPELVEQILDTNKLLEDSLQSFGVSRDNRDNDPEYYGNGGSQHLKKVVEYQNRVNNRIGKIWVLYKNEVKDYHKRIYNELQVKLPNANKIEPITTSAFGIGGTTKTIPQLLEQLELVRQFLEKALGLFVESRSNRDIDSGYYSNAGSQYLTKVLEYQNRMNNRIGKIWIVYKQHANAFNKTPVNNTPPKVVVNDSGLIPGSIYIANTDFTKVESGEIDLVTNQSYIVLETSTDNGWVLVVNLITKEQGHVPSAFLSVYDKQKYVELEIGKTYIGLETAKSDMDVDMGVIEYDYYTALENDSNGWGYVRNLTTNKEGYVYPELLSRQDVPQKQIISSMYEKMKNSGLPEGPIRHKAQLDGVILPPDFFGNSSSPLPQKTDVTAPPISFLDEIKQRKHLTTIIQTPPSVKSTPISILDAIKQRDVTLKSTSDRGATTPPVKKSNETELSKVISQIVDRRTQINPDDSDSDGDGGSGWDSTSAKIKK